jgi:hypothetical protein
MPYIIAIYQDDEHLFVGPFVTEAEADAVDETTGGELT